MKTNLKYLNSTTIVTGTCLLMTAFFSFMLYSSYSKKKDTSSKEQIGTLSFKKESTLRKYSGQVIWDDIDQSMPVYNGDAIRTERMSEAIIKLADGSHISLEQESMIILTMGTESIDIGFNYGSMSTKRDTQQGRYKNLKINTDKMTLNIEKSNLQLKGKKDGELNVAVREGSADIVSKEKKVIKISKLEEAVIPGGSAEVRISPVLFSLIEPDNNKYITGASATIHVQFRWEKKGDVKSAIFELSEGPSFTGDITSKEAGNTNLTLDLQPGTYYWRLRDGKTGKAKTVYSETFKFTVIKEDPVRLLYPERGQRFSFYSTPPAINMQWEKSHVASSYRVLISKNPSFTKPSISRDIVENAITEFGMDEGVWHWKVLIKTPFRDSYSDIGSARSFTIVKQKTLPPPIPISPEDNKKIHKELINKNKLDFSWKASPDIARSEFLLSDDKNFKNIILRTTTGGNYISLNTPIQPGSYYWKVISSTKNKDVELPSDVRHFLIMKEDTITLTNPKDNFKFEKPFSIDKLPMKFEWESNYTEVRYIFELSPTQDFSEPKLKKELRTTSFSIDNLEHGTYYWRVIAIDQYGNEILKSQSHQLGIIPTLDRAALIEPKNRSIINLKDRDSLEMTWSKIKGAQFYMVRLYHYQGGKKIIINAARTKQNSLSLTDLSKLDRGNFSWSVTGLRMDKNAIYPAVEGPESTGYFEITLGKKLNKPKIISPVIQYGE